MHLIYHKLEMFKNVLIRGLKPKMIFHNTVITKSLDPEVQRSKSSTRGYLYSLKRYLGKLSDNRTQNSAYFSTSLLAAKEFGAEHLLCVAFRRILEENIQGTIKNLI